jgi:NAD(P)H dehydrogenase (quinone)
MIFRVLILSALTVSASAATIKGLLDLRREESAATAQVLIVYHSETGYTKTLAEAIRAGASAGGAEVRFLSCKNATYKDVLWADAIVVGSPTHYGNPSADILSWFEKEWEDGFYDPALDGKIGTAFATGGGMNQGVEHVVTGLQRALESFRIRYIAPDPSRNGYHSYGGVAITGTEPFNLTAPHISKQFLQPGKDLGAKVASAASRIHNLNAANEL